MGWHGGSLEYLFTPELAEQAAHDMTVDGTRWLYRKIVEHTPVHQEFGGGGGRWAAANRERGRAPGTLKRSWYMDPEGVIRRARGTNFIYIGRVNTDDPVAPYVEDDTRAHIIRPVHAKRLRFRVWPSGAAVYASFVRHPGTTGQHMVRRAEEEARAEFPHIVDGPLQRWARAQARHCERENRLHPVHVGQTTIGAA